MTHRDYFNINGLQPTYKDPEILRKFTTPRGKVLPKDKSGLTAKNQRKVAKHIKYARFLGLLPYTSYQSEKLARSAAQ